MLLDMYVFTEFELLETKIFVQTSARRTAYCKYSNCNVKYK